MKAGWLGWGISFACAGSLVTWEARAFACSSDAQCKGARVCDDGVCVTPKKAALGSSKTVSKTSPESPSDSGGSRWYGWQTLLMDGAAWGLLYAGSRINSDASVVVGGAGMIATLIGAPIIHSAHDNGARGWISFGIRGGGLTLMLIGLGSSTKDSLHPLTYVGAAAMLAAIPIDAAALAYESHATGVGGVRVVPLVGHGVQGVMLGATF